MPSHQRAQRLWLSLAELLLAALAVLLRLFHATHTPVPEALFAPLVLHCAALRDPSLWTSATLSADAGELLGLVARCMGHADVASLLSRQLMPVLRLLDAELKAHDLRQCSASIRAFLWLALRLRHPHAGAFANPLVSLTMRVLDRHETAYKVIAIRILSHLLAEADATQIRWHGELLFDTLKRQLVYREEAITTPLLPALTRCAIILEVAPGGARNAELLTEIIKELEWNTKRELVALYLAQLPPLIAHNGLHVVRYFSRLFPVLTSLLPNASEASALHLLATFDALLTHCWPRMRARKAELIDALKDMRPALSSDAVAAALNALTARLDAFSVPPLV